MAGTSLADSLCPQARRCHPILGPISFGKRLEKIAGERHGLCRRTLRFDVEREDERLALATRGAGEREKKKSVVDVSVVMGVDMDRARRGLGGAPAHDLEFG